MVTSTTNSQFQQATANNAHQASEIMQLNQDKETLRKHNQDKARQVQSLQRELNDMTEELAVADSDKVRFKELSEQYMSEVARLEA